MRASNIRIYLGLETRTGAYIARRAVRRFHAKACASASLTFGQGVWEGATETCAIIEIVQAEKDNEIAQADNTARWIAEHYQSQFDQALVIWYISEGRTGQTTSQASYVRR